MRFAAGIEYDGSGFCGWQRQDAKQSVQACLETALSHVANHPISVIAAGRTDAGVHALQQVAHFDVFAQRTSRAWVLGTNCSLPLTIRVLWVQAVSEEFHARFSAKARAYRYVIYCNPVSSALLYHRVTWIHTPLDVEKMTKAADFLIGTHDFSAFRAAACQAKSPIKTMYQCQVHSINSYIYIDVEASGFLHHMVRNIAGVLIMIGRNLQPPEWANEVLMGRDRTKAGITASPNGLYLIGVQYAESFGLPRGQFSTCLMTI